MNSRLLQLAVDLSFERVVYVGARRHIVNIFLIIMTVTMFYFFFHDLAEIKSKFEWKHLYTIVPFAISVIALIIVGSKSINDILDVSFWKFKERGEVYRELARSKIKLQFEFDSGDFYGLEYDKAIELLKEEYDIIKSEYKRVLIAFLGVAGVVWYQFVSKLFALPQFDNLEKVLELFFSLIVFCIIFTAIHFAMRIIVVSTTKLSKIEAFITSN